MKRVSKGLGCGGDEAAGRWQCQQEMQESAGGGLGGGGECMKCMNGRRVFKPL